MRKLIPRIFSKCLNKNAQSMLEQIALFILVGSGIIVMGPYVEKAWNAGLKSIDDSVIESHYDPLMDGTVTDICSGAGSKKDGGWSLWGPCICKPVGGGAGECTVVRTCTNPAPSCGGAPCQVVNGFGASKTISCNPPCSPVDGGWVGCNPVTGVCDNTDSHWTPWSQCLGCQQFRTKTQKDHCTNPRPSCGGKSCGTSPIQWRACGGVSGHWEMTPGSCNNCNKIDTYRCTAACGMDGCNCSDLPDGAVCAKTTTVRSNCGGACNPGNTCAGPTSYYTTGTCSSGTCLGAGTASCPPAYITECKSYGPSTCVDGSGCVPSAETNAPDGTICDNGIDYCAPDKTGWYSAKTCVSGICSGIPAGGYFTACPAATGGSGTPTDICNEVAASKCDISLIHSIPKYCTKEGFVNTTGRVCDTTPVCAGGGDTTHYYARTLCESTGMASPPYSCTRRDQYTECFPNQTQADNMAASRDCVNSMEASTCNTSATSLADICNDPVYHYEPVNHECIGPPICYSATELAEGVLCDGKGNCINPKVVQDCNAGAPNDVLYCRETTGTCETSYDPDRCVQTITRVCKAGEVCIPDTCKNFPGTYDTDQCGSGKIWVED